MTDLGTLGGPHSYARMVSDDGSVVAGVSSTAGGDSHAFRWVADSMTDLGTWADAIVMLRQCRLTVQRSSGIL